MAWERQILKLNVSSLHGIEGWPSPAEAAWDSEGDCKAGDQDDVHLSVP